MILTKRIGSFSLIFSLVLAMVMFCAVPQSRASTESEAPREAILAGTWYPADSLVLREQVNGFLQQVPPHTETGPLMALISPHAGYRYSGQVAAHAYKLLEGANYETVIVVAPSHHASFEGVSVYDGGEYRTPLGELPLDLDLIAKLKEADSQIYYRSSAHNREHSLEIQLPFLQVVQPGIHLVPLVMGDQRPEACRRLAETLVKCIRGKSVLLVASSDLSHFYDDARAKELDARLAEHVRSMDVEALGKDLARGRCEACGGGPMMTVMLAAKELGADHSEILHTANSGDVTGDRSRVVGYMAAALWAKPESADPAHAMSAHNSLSAFSLNEQEMTVLHGIARDAIQCALDSRSYKLPADLPPILSTPCGAFVTLKKNKRLRGCIGSIISRQPLAETVERVAVSAALEDPRFPPVSAAEWPDLSLEISVLSPLVQVLDIAVIQPGTHGLLIRRGGRTGLLLPQVATEYGWDRITFLKQTCRKAGLAQDAWEKPDTEIFAFTAQVF
ncbi:MAG: AmmeMemoRadiSam system protein B [Deltaproteobacteria bacterium]|nr:AmmeMemoRadiSam system protein B [Deltaproteobacteria bacterium]